MSASRPKEPTTDTFVALYDRMGTAIADRDRAGLAELLDERYVFTSPDGNRLNREEVLTLEMLIPPPEQITLDSVLVVSPELAVVRGHDTVLGAFPDGSVSGPLAAQMLDGVVIAFTAVWTRDGSEWRVLSNDAHVLATGAVASEHPLDPRPGFEESLVERLTDWMLATFRGDSEAQARFEHEDAIFTYPGGRRFTQSEHIAATGQATGLREHDVTELRCRQYGDDLAIVWLDHTLRTELTDDPFGDPELVASFREGVAFAMTSTWRRFGEDWRLIGMDANVLQSGFVPREERTHPNVITYSGEGSAR